MKIITTNRGSIIIMADGNDISGRVNQMKRIVKEYGMTKLDIILMIIPFCEGLVEALQLANLLLDPTPFDMFTVHNHE